MNTPKPDESDDKNRMPSQEDGDSVEDEEVQAAYRKAFHEQMRQLGCPGCGDDNPFV